MPRGSSRRGARAPGAGGLARAAGGGAGAAASVRALLPAAVLAYALLGEPGAALAAAAAWALSLAGEAWSRGGARPDPGTRIPDERDPSPGEGKARAAGAADRLRPLLPAGIAFAAFLAVFLSSDLLRGGLPVRSAFLDSIQSALTCTVLLLPLGLPAEAALLKGRTGREGFPRVEEFQFTCCAGMSLAAAGAVLAGWLPPLSTAQLLWANVVGTALPSLAPGADEPAPTAGERLTRILPSILASAFLLALLLLAVYRLGLGYAGDTPRAADRARSLVFLALCLVQAGEPLAGRGGRTGTGNPRSRAREFAARLGAVLAALAPAAAAFLVPGARTFLGLSVPEPAASASALAAAGGFLVLRFAARRIRSPIPRNA